MRIVKASIQDETSLNELAVRAKQTWGYPKEWIELWKKDVLRLKKELLKQGRVFKAMKDFDLLGFYALDGNPPHLILGGFWIDPKYQNKGVGKKLFSHLLQKASSLKAKTLQWESDPYAEAFYLKMGAKKISERTYDLLGQRRTLSIYEVVL